MTANLYGNAKKNANVKALRNYDEMYLSLINCPSLISNEDWLKAQSIKGNRNKLAPRSNTSKISFLCGLVKCGKCGSNLVTQGCQSSNGIKHYYLMCSTKRNMGASVCNNKMIDVHTLENIVLNDIKNYFNSKDISDKIERYVKTNKRKNVELLKQKEELENKMIKIDIQIQNLINSIAEGNTTVSKYVNQKIDELEDEKQYIESELKKISTETNTNEDTSLIDYVKNINEKLNTSNLDELKMLCKTIIDKIVVTDGNIDIHYKI